MSKKKTPPSYGESAGPSQSIMHEVRRVTVWHVVVFMAVISHGMVWHGMAWYGMAWYGMVDVCETLLAAEAARLNVWKSVFETYFAPVPEGAGSRGQPTSHIKTVGTILKVTRWVTLWCLLQYMAHASRDTRSKHLTRTKHRGAQSKSVLKTKTFGAILKKASGVTMFGLLDPSWWPAIWRRRRLSAAHEIQKVHFKSIKSSQSCTEQKQYD